MFARSLLFVGGLSVVLLLSAGCGTSGDESAGGGDTPTPSEGAAGAPLAVTVPYAGMVATTGAPSYYQLSASTGGTNTIFLTAPTANVDPVVFTDPTFNTVDTTWICTAELGTLDDTCIGPTAGTGTPVYLKVLNLTGDAGATFTLNITD